MACMHAYICPWQSKHASNKPHSIVRQFLDLSRHFAGPVQSLLGSNQCVNGAWKYQHYCLWQWTVSQPIAKLGQTYRASTWASICQDSSPKIGVQVLVQWGVGTKAGVSHGSWDCYKNMWDNENDNVHCRTMIVLPISHLQAMHTYIQELC